MRKYLRLMIITLVVAVIIYLDNAMAMNGYFWGLLFIVSEISGYPTLSKTLNEANFIEKVPHSGLALIIAGVFYFVALGIVSLILWWLLSGMIVGGIPYTMCLFGVSFLPSFYLVFNAEKRKAKFKKQVSEVSGESTPKRFEDKLKETKDKKEKK